LSAIQHELEYDPRLGDNKVNGVELLVFLSFLNEKDEGFNYFTWNKIY